VNAHPLVTVGLPTYNGSRFLREAIESILAQDLEDFELVISDNGSTDATEEIARATSARDPRVRYQRVAENRGAAWNYNRVLALARGRYFKWAADDDICAPSFLRRCADELDRSPAAVVAFPQTTIIDEHGEPTGTLDDDDLDLRAPDPVERLSQLLRHRIEWHPVFGVIRTEALRRTRGISTLTLSDAALLAELAMLGEFHQVPERLFLRRYHDARSIVANPTFEAYASWYDPHRRRRAVLPNAELVLALLRRVLEAPLATVDRARAGAAVLQLWALPHWRHIGGEARLALLGAGSRRSSVPRLLRPSASRRKG
jgi:glycosyltransferase involved in cell wall biosynthesis